MQAELGTTPSSFSRKSRSKIHQGKACVAGDSVGDPFKDASGPSLDILMKLMAMLSSLTAPLVEGVED